MKPIEELMQLVAQTDAVRRNLSTTRGMIRVGVSDQSGVFIARVIEGSASDRFAAISETEAVTIIEGLSKIFGWSTGEMGVSKTDLAQALTCLSGLTDFVRNPTDEKQEWAVKNLDFLRDLVGRLLNQFPKA